MADPLEQPGDQTPALQSDSFSLVSADGKAAGGPALKSNSFSLVPADDSQQLKSDTFSIVGPGGDLTDMSKVAGADPGMQSPMQAAGTQQYQPMEKLGMFDALTANPDAPKSNAQLQLEQRQNDAAASAITGGDPALASQQRQIAGYYQQQDDSPIESAVRAVPVAGDVAAGGYHVARGMSGLAEQEGDILGDPRSVEGGKAGVDKTLHSATEAIGGAMDLTMPAFGAAGMVSPIKTAATYFTAIAAGHAAADIAKKLNMSPDEQNFANVVGTFIPIVFHTVTQLDASIGEQTARVRDADGNIREVPVKTAAVGGRGFGFGVGKGEDGSVYAAGRVGPFSARAKWGGNPEGAPAPDTGLSQPALPPPPPDPIEQMTNDRADAIQGAAIRADQTQQKAEDLAAGVQPPSVPMPEGMDDGALTPKTVGLVGRAIQMLPEPMRPKAILEAVGNLAKWMLGKRTIIGPDMKVTSVDTPQAAQKEAVGLVNDEIERQNQAQQQQAEQQQQDTQQAQQEQEESLQPTKPAEAAKKPDVEIPDNPHTQLARRILSSLPDNTPAANMDQALRDRILLPTPIRTALVAQEVQRRASEKEARANEALTGQPTPEGQKPHEIEQQVALVKKGEAPFAHIHRLTTHRPTDTKGLSRTTVKGAGDNDGIYFHGSDISGADIRIAARKGTLNELAEKWKNGKAPKTEEEGGGTPAAPQQETHPAKSEAVPPTSFEGEEGKKTNILLADGSSIPATHRMVELSSLTPSHNGMSFEPNPIYPPKVQERSYHSSKAEQAKVIDHATNFEPSYIVNTNPDATNGAPIVTSKPVTIDGVTYPAGTVLGGNSRVMTLQRVYTNGAEAAYREALLENHRSFGFPPEVQEPFNQPVHVREIEPPQTLEEMHRLGSLLNKPPTQSLDKFDQAVSIGKQLSPDTLSGISDLIRQASDRDSTATLNAVLSDKSLGKQVVRMLRSDGIIFETNEGQFVDPSTQLLTAAARTQLGDALLANLLDNRKLMEDTPYVLKQKLIGSIGSIAAITSTDDGWNLKPALKEAAKQYGELSRMPHPTIEDAMAQPNMLEERGPVLDALIRQYDKNVGEVRKAFSMFTTGAMEGRNQNGLLGITAVPEPYLDFNFAFGTELTKEQFEEEMAKIRGEGEKATDGITQTAPATADTTTAVHEPEEKADVTTTAVQPEAETAIKPATQGEILPPAAKPEIRPIKKGDQVIYTTNAGKERPGVVHFADDRIVRIRDARTGTVITKKRADVRHADHWQNPAPSMDAAEKPEITPVKEQPQLEAPKQEDPDKTSLVDHLNLLFDRYQGPKNYHDLKRIVTEFDGKEPDQLRMKVAQEAYETMLGRIASKIMLEAHGGQKEAYNALVRLYEGQPNLSIRTSTSIANQAYSTPMPLAFIADKLAGIEFRSTSVYEPTAGNGNLLIGANPELVIANEIEPTRIGNLRDEGFNVTTNDATSWAPSQKFDAVVMNPPFGSLPAPIKFDGYEINKLDHLIALKALSVMKDDGRASVIIGATKEPGEVAAKDKPFFNYLYSHYNVVQDFELDGDLYSRQGASWPVRVLAIDGRARSNNVLPRASEIQRLSTWEEVYEHASQYLGANLEGRRRADNELVSEVRGESPVSKPVPAAASGSDSIAHSGGQETSPEGYTGSIGSGQPGPIVHTGRVPEPRVGSPDNVVASDGDVAASDRLAEDQPRPKAVRREPAKSAGHPADASVIADESSNQFQAVYTPYSEKKDVNVLAPKGMVHAMHSAMERLSNEVGDLDQYVTDELGYSSIEDMQKAYMGLQVDTIAAEIHAVQRGKGVIIADQTGVGKGRQAAAIIRYAILNGITPIFITAKPNLFSDMYSDLHDIGSGNAVTPLLLNANAKITHPVTGEKILGNKQSEHGKNMQRILETGKLPEGRNALFLTYSQINKPNRQQLILQRLAPNSIFILDEAHKAGGESNTGLFMQSILAHAKAATFLSATYAKRPDNLPLYADMTSISLAIPDREKIVSAIEAGGAPLQAIVSYQLAQAGELFRRERSYDGIKFSTHVFDNRREEHERTSDAVTEVLRAIVAADEAFHLNDFQDIREEVEGEGGTAMAGGNQASKTVNHANFTSVVHNAVKQMLLGLKADDVADQIIADIRNGIKPIIALESTMGSFLTHYVESNGLQKGAPLHNFNYGTVLKRSLDRTRYYNEKDSKGEVTRVEVPLESLSDATRALYEAAHNLIKDLKVSIPVSPIDWIKHRVKQAGHTIAEVTGRDHAIDYSREVPVLSSVDDIERKDRVATINGFNNGGIDSMILNQAGSTGLSAHASEKFRDQRPRRMYIVQPQGDINEQMQIMGRVNRTGQVVLPSYITAATALPAEIRPSMVLSTKLKSLNANTTSNTRSNVQIESPDMINKYGDQVVKQYLAENPEMATDLRLDAGEDDDDNDADENLARKATGRAALLPVAQQKEFFAAITESYKDLIKYLDDTGQNDLEPKTYDFDAEPIGTAQVVHQGSDKSNPFGQDAFFQEYRIKKQGKPFTADEVREMVKDGLQGERSGADHYRKLMGEMDKKYETFLSKQTVASARERAVQTRQGSQGFMSTYRVGSGARVEINGETYNAVVVGIEPAKNPKGNPYAISSIKFELALNSPIRSIKIPGTEFQKITVGPQGTVADINYLFHDPNPNARMIARIITGNMLGAYGALQGPNSKGRVVSFTMNDGSHAVGMLMPARFDPRQNISTEYCIRTPEAVEQTVRAHHGSGFAVTAPGGDVQIQREGPGIIIKTKSSKAVGGKFFNDKALLAHIDQGNFYSRNGMMVGHVIPGHERQALQIVMGKAALYATASMTNQAREFDQAAAQNPTPPPPPPAPTNGPQRPSAPSVQLDDKERAMLEKINGKWTNSENLLREMGENDAEFRQYSDAIARLVRKGLVERKENAEWGTDFRRTPDGTAALKQKPSLGQRLLDEEGSVDVDKAAEYIKNAVPATWNEITKTAKSSGKSAKKIGRELLAAFTPTMLADADMLDIMGPATGEPKLRIFEATQLMRGVDKMFKGMSQEQQVEFVDRWQKGIAQPSTDLQNAQDLMQSILEQQRAREMGATNLGRDKDHQIDLTQKENYFPNRYSKPPSDELIPSDEEQILRLFSRRPLEGSKAFLKKQKYTLKEAVEKNAVPLGTPVHMILKRMEEGAKYVAAKTCWYQFKESGLATFVRNGRKAPENYVKVNDKSSQVFRKIVMDDGNEAFLKTGEWYVHREAARLLNNYLSTDLIRGTEIGRAFVAAKTAATSMRMAFSVFHYLNIGLETISSGVNIGMDQAWNQGVRNLDPTKISAGLADIGRSITAPGAMWMAGRKALKYVRNPDEFLATPEGQKWAQENPDFPGQLKRLFGGGLRMDMGEDFRDQYGKDFVQAMKEGRLGSGMLKAVPWLAHLVAEPLFKHYIPVVKLAFACQLLSLKDEQYAQALAAGTITEETIAREVAATVDNRFGEFNWDSLYLNNTLRTGLNLVFRSPGWHLGSWRMISSAVSEIVAHGHDDRIFDKIDQEADQWTWAREQARKLPQLGANTGAILAMAFTVAAFGTVISKLTTGKWPWTLAEESVSGLPKFAQAALECLHPSTGVSDEHGQPIRINFPTGLKVYEQAGEDPMRYFRGTIADWLAGAYDTGNNRDWRNNFVYDPQGTAGKKFLEGLEYNLKANGTPFMADNMQKNYGKPEPGGMKVARAAGVIGGAPRRMDESSALAHALVYVHHEPHTPDQEEAYALSQHQAPTRYQVLRAAREKNYTYLEKVVLHDLTYPQAKEIYEKYATPAERQQLRPIIERKRTLEIMKARRQGKPM